MIHQLLNAAMHIRAHAVAQVERNSLPDLSGYFAEVRIMTQRAELLQPALLPVVALPKSPSRYFLPHEQPLADLRVFSSAHAARESDLPDDQPLAIIVPIHFRPGHLAWFTEYAGGPDDAV